MSPGRPRKGDGKKAQVLLEKDVKERPELPPYKKLLWCTERRGQIIDFWIAFSNMIIIVGRLTREAWTHYRWEGRSSGRA